MWMSGGEPTSLSLCERSHNGGWDGSVLIYRVGRHIIDYLLLTFILGVPPCDQSTLPILPDLRLPKKNESYTPPYCPVLSPSQARYLMIGDRSEGAFLLIDNVRCRLETRCKLEQTEPCPVLQSLTSASPHLGI